MTYLAGYERNINQPSGIITGQEQVCTYEISRPDVKQYEILGLVVLAILIIVGIIAYKGGKK